MTDAVAKTEKLLEMSPYSLCAKEKHELYGDLLNELCIHHRENCDEYKKFTDAFTGCDFDHRKLTEEEIPMLPVGIFKRRSLKSIKTEDEFKQLTSSGTTGQSVSRIFLDKQNAAYQQEALVKIVSDFLGAERMPLLYIESPDILKDRNKFSARGAGIMGFRVFGTRAFYALDNEMNLDLDAVDEFLERYGDQKFLVFGFTYMIWKHFYRELQRRNLKLDMKNAVMIHGGGWKKLQDEAVSADEFKKEIQRVSGISEIHDYYGMAEQTGCIYMECECGHLHASIFSDVITRRSSDFTFCENGENGIIEVLTPLAHSYPGHAILTEDEGIILGEDDCPCGRKGKYFKITGRISQAEIRGCSDTYEG